MSRSIRRKERALTSEESLQILHKGEYGILATVDAQGAPYATPLSYILLNDKVYFHSAVEGHKVDNLRVNPRCSFTVIGKTQPVFVNDFSTYYESVIVFGTAELVEDMEERVLALTELARKYLPEHMDKAEKSIAASLSRTAVYAVHIEGMSGKAKKPRA